MSHCVNLETGEIIKGDTDDEHEAIPEGNRPGGTVGGGGKCTWLEWFETTSPIGRRQLAKLEREKRLGLHD